MAEEGKEYDSAAEPPVFRTTTERRSVRAPLKTAAQFFGSLGFAEALSLERLKPGVKGCIMNPKRAIPPFRRPFGAFPNHCGHSSG